MWLDSSDDISSELACICVNVHIYLCRSLTINRTWTRGLTGGFL